MHIDAREGYNSNVRSEIISENTKLVGFSTYDTNVGEVVITDNKELKDLYLSYGEIKKRDFLNNPALKSFSLKPLNDIDYPLNFSIYPKLTSTDVVYDGQFLSINVSNDFLLGNLH